MEPTRVVIEKMPGPAFVEFMLQWGGLGIAAAAAAATVFAVVVALRRNRQVDERQAEMDRRRASLYAASLEVRLLGLIAEYDVVIPRIRFADPHGVDDRYTWMLEHLDGVRHDISAEELVHLVPLGDGTAHRIARGLGMVVALRQTMRSRVKYAKYKKEYPLIPNADADKAAAALNDALGYLQIAYARCKEFADAYATAPSHEEIYGEPGEDFDG